MGFSRQEHWGGLPLPPPGHLPDLDQSPVLAGRFFIAEPLGKPLFMNYLTQKQSIQARIPEAQDYWYLGVDHPLLWGVLCTGGCLPASLVSIHGWLEASSPAHEDQKVSRHPSSVPPGHSHPGVGTSNLEAVALVLRESPCHVREPRWGAGPHAVPPPYPRVMLAGPPVESRNHAWYPTLRVLCPALCMHTSDKGDL